MSDKIHGFAQACLDLYQDKIIEINTGESRTTLLLSDFQREHKSLLRGKLLSAIGDGLIIECSVGAIKKKVLINVWTIISITEAEDGLGMKDIYVDEEFRSRRRG
jgi:hypothetical protein